MLGLIYKIRPTSIMKFFVALFAIGGAVWLGNAAQENGFIRDLVAGYGYAGMFVVSIISGFNLAVPVPAISFMPLFLASGLNFWISIGVVAAGVTIGDSIGFFIGKAGRQIFVQNEEKTFARLQKLRDWYYWAPIVALGLFAMIVPFPNEVLAVPLGLLGYRGRHVIPVMLIGNIVFNTLAASGILGISSFFR